VALLIAGWTFKGCAPKTEEGVVVSPPEVQAALEAKRQAEERQRNIRRAYLQMNRALGLLQQGMALKLDAQAAGKESPDAVLGEDGKALVAKAQTILQDRLPNDPGIGPLLKAEEGASPETDALMQLHAYLLDLAEFAANLEPKNVPPEEAVEEEAKEAEEEAAGEEMEEVEEKETGEAEEAKHETAAPGKEATEGEEQNPEAATAQS